jgi:hypothetical protein
MRLQDAGALLKLGADLLDLVPRQRLLPDRLAALRAVKPRASKTRLNLAADDRPYRTASGVRLRLARAET